MTKTISLKELEARAFRSTVQDGLWDVFIGCLPLQLAIAPFLAPSLGDFWSSAVFLPFWLLVYIVVHTVRKRVVAPRVGVMKFGEARKAKLIRVNILLFVVLLVALVLSTVSAVYFDVMPGWMINAAFGVTLLVFSGVMAHFFELPQLYTYGALLALSPLAGEWLWVNMKVPHHGYPVTFGATAAFIILSGLVKFVRVVRANPLPAEGSASGETRDDRLAD